MKTGAIYSLKGGVGKTAAAVNLASEAALDGRHVLLWDLDPQGAASWYLGVDDPPEMSAKRIVSGKAPLGRYVQHTDQERLDVLPFFNLTLAYNSGAAFSFLAGAGGWQRWFFAAVAVIAVVLILGWMRKLREERMQGAALALILGGAVGNLYDRVVLGHVVDFLDFYWGDYHFPAFNIADTAITIGAALIILDMLLGGRRGHD